MGRPLPRRRSPLGSKAAWIADYPDLVSEWHPTKNRKLRPEEVRHGSACAIWWRCAKGPDHVWMARAGSRVAHGSGCPFCLGRRLSVTNSLQARRPDTAALWDRKRNGSLRPQDVTAFAARTVWWSCPKGPDHLWRALVHRTQGCPYCVGFWTSITNCVATVAPALAAEWHPTLNVATPTDLTPGSNVRVWWRCWQGHIWRAMVCDRWKGTGCPRCQKEKRPVTRAVRGKGSLTRLPGSAKSTIASRRMRR